MPQPSYIVALDQGTTSSRAILVDHGGNICASASQEFRQYYPQPGWVEHDAQELWESQLAAARDVLTGSLGTIASDQIAAIGIANQRETVVLWDRATGEPLHRAIVWQCRRTAALCDLIRKEGFANVIQEKTGLITDAYFSGTKIVWFLENIPGARERAQRGELACGTVDSWLMWNLTRGATHETDVSNASRTMLFNIRTLDWDAEILRHFSIDRSLLPAVTSSSGHLGDTDVFGGRIPVAGVAGDQQAALFGHQCFAPGSAKNTYGTGCFLLMNAGTAVPQSDCGLLATVAWKRNSCTTYALEGSIFIAGAAVQWLRDELGIINAAADTERMVAAVPDNGGVYFVPAFVGLGAPYWDSYARGAILGLTRGSNRNHIVRAAIESMAYQTRTVMDCMAQDSGIQPEVLRVDGGAAQNDFLCQFQADMLGVPVERSAIAESTALGAAYLAGLAVGFWKDEQELRQHLGVARRFEPAMTVSERDRLYSGWQKAAERAKGWAR
jgi:glycerol kinase